MRRSFYRFLLLAYPAPHRREFGRDMLATFDALCREPGAAGVGGLRLFAREAIDAVRNGLRERRGHAAAGHAAGSGGGPRPVRDLRLPDNHRGGGPMRAFLQDLRFAARALAARPGFALIAIFTLALGIGATTLIFSVAHAVVFRPLPYEQPERLVMVGSEFGQSGRLSSLTPLDFLDLRDRSESLASIAASASATLDAAGEGAPMRFGGARVSSGFFAVLGVEPLLGREFTGDEEIPGNDRVAVISHDAWQSYWGGDPEVVGRTVTLNRLPHTVVGVMPADFRPPEGIRYQPDVDIWLPLAIDRDESNRFSSYLWTIGRLRDDATLSSATAELEALTVAFQREFYNGDQNFAFRIEPLHERTVGTIGGTLAVMLGAVGLLLLIACANVANLSLARGADRGQEFAMRSALGAGRGRVVQQLLLESGLLSLSGGAVGALLALGGVRLLPLVDPGRIPRSGEVTLDLQVLAFAFGLSVSTGVLFGLAPAVQITRSELNDVLKSGARRVSTRAADRMRASLLVVQTALALTLLIGAGLLVNSFVRLARVDPGFEPDGLMAMRLYIPPESPTGSRWAPADEAEWYSWRSFYSDLLEKVEAIPGVSAAAGTTSPPIIGAEIWMSIVVEGKEADPDNPTYMADNRVSPDYFRTIGATLVRGRELSRDDDDGESHAIVNQAFAELNWPGEDPIGKRFGYGSRVEAVGDWITVVGLVGNTTQAELGSDPQPEFFVPFFQNPSRAMTIVARYEGDRAALAEAMRQAVWSLKPDLPVNRVEPMGVTVAGSITQPRFYMLLLTTFAAVAMALATVGIYGTMAYAVGRRTREVGVRMALGARRADVLRLIVGQGMKVTAIGLILGIAGAAGLARFIESFVFGVEPTDPVTFAAVVAILAVVAVLACYLPARRAAALDPADTLRAD